MYGVERVGDRMGEKSLRASGQAADVRWLEQRRRLWYAVKDIPLPLRPYFINEKGQQRKRLIKSLGTDSLEVARQRRHAALALFEAEFARVRMAHGAEAAVKNAATWHDRIVHAAMQQSAIPRDRIVPVALEHREAIVRLEKGDVSSVHMSEHAPVAPDSTPAEAALSVARWVIDDEADRIRAEHGQAAADTFAEIATAQATPLEPLIERWLGEEDVEERSKNDHRRAATELLAWVRATDRRETVEQFNRRIAGDYVSRLLSLGLDRKKTVGKRLWSLSALWRYLIRKGYTETNVWLGHNVGNGRSSRDKHPERPFTADELRRLLDGPAEPPLRDMMRMALYSGARIEELALLRVADINAAERTMHIQADPKTPASRRTVPIHSEVWPIVEARVKGKPTDAFLLHELGSAPKPGRQRSMPISKRFGRYRAEVGVEDRRDGQRRSLVNFHSFRRTFVTLAEQAGQPESTIRAVVGHKRQGMTFGVYSGGPSLEQRRACVESVRLPAGA